MTNDQAKMLLVRKLRTTMGLTQTQLGFRLGLSLSTILRYETIRPPTGKALADLAKFASRSSQPELAEAFMNQLGSELDLPQIASVVL